MCHDEAFYHYCTWNEQMRFWKWRIGRESRPPWPFWWGPCPNGRRWAIGRSSRSHPFLRSFRGGGGGMWGRNEAQLLLTTQEIESEENFRDLNDNNHCGQTKHQKQKETGRWQGSRWTEQLEHLMESRTNSILSLLNMRDSAFIDLIKVRPQC